MKTKFPFISPLIKYLVWIPLVSSGLYAQEFVHGLDGSSPNTGVTAGRTLSNQSIGNTGSSNLFNGSHNVYIPIYDFENAYGSYGVGLSYNTKGVKVDEIATEVGLHWNLTAGGSITRQIKDLPDELSITPIAPHYDEFGNPFLRYVGKMAHNFNVVNRPYVSDAIHDQEHDDFIVNVAGMSFTFNIGDQGYVFTHPNKHVKIEPLYDNAVQVVNAFSIPNRTKFGFKITDDQGVVYIFRPCNYTSWEEPRVFRPLLPPATVYNIILYDFPVEWNLERITFPDGSEIVYTYGLVKYLSSQVAYTYTFSHTGSLVGYQDDRSIKKNFIQKIEYPNNEVVRFAYIDHSCTYTYHILDSIIVTEGSRSLKYALEHDIEASLPYTNKFDKRAPCQTLSSIPAGFTQKDYYRLFLREINVHGMTGSLSENLYGFRYNFLKLPPHKSGKQDFFGYYNGNTGTILENGRSLMPTHTKIGGGSYTGTSRHYSGTHAQAGLLTEVHNGYGGITKFSYEGHNWLTSHLPFTTLASANNNSELADGVRIKSIETIDPGAPDMRTEVSYFYEGGQQFTPYVNIYTVSKYNAGGTPAEFKYFSHITSPLLLVNNSNVGYSKVTATTRNVDNAQLSKTISYFTNLNDHLSSHTAKYIRVGSGSHYYSQPYNYRQYLKDWEIGLEYKTESYDHADNILKIIENFYNFILDTTSTIGKVENIKSAYAQNPHVDSAGYYKRHSFGSYRPFSGNVLINKMVSRNYYSSTAYVTDEVKFTYNNRNKIHSTETVNSEGRRFITYSIYNSDIKPPMSSSLIFDYPLTLQVAQERWTRDDVEDPSSIYLLESAVFFHDKAGTHLLPSRKSFISRFENQIKDISFTGYAYTNVANFTANRYNYIKNIYDTGAAPFGFELLTHSEKYDARNKPTEISALNGVKTDAVIYDQVSGDVLANIVNAPYNQVGFTGFDEAVKTGSGKIYTHEDIFITGNFRYQGHGIETSHTALGNDYICGQSYRLKALLPPPGVSHPVLIYQNTLQSGKKYVLSFWSKGGTPTLQGTGSALGTYSFQTKYTVGSWKYYVVFLTPTGNTGLTIRDNGTSGVIIDEVRLQPLTSRMTTQTYGSIVGVTAEADTDGRITYYEYDDLGRLVLIRDQDGHIIKKYERNKL